MNIFDKFFWKPSKIAPVPEMGEVSAKLKMGYYVTKTHNPQVDEVGMFIEHINKAKQDPRLKALFN